MKYVVLLLLCLSLLGCAKSNNQSSSQGPNSSGAATQSGGPLKKDPGIEAALYALQTIDYVESLVEKPSAMHPVSEMDDDVSSAISKVPASDMALQDELRDLHIRVSGLAIDKLTGKETYSDHVESYHKVHDELLAKIKKLAATRNASADIPTVNELEVAHASGPKWTRLRDDARQTIYYKLPAKNAIIEKDPSLDKDQETRLRLNVTCGKDLMILIDTVSVQTEKVTLKFDGSAPVKETWIATNTGILSSHPASLFNRFLKARTFSVELTPRHRATQTVNFDLADFKEMPGEDRNCKH